MVYWQDLPEETLADVMTEIMEERERRRVVDVEALKPWLEAWIKGSSRQKRRITQRDLDMRDAFLIVLKLIDDLQGR